MAGTEFRHCSNCLFFSLFVSVVSGYLCGVDTFVFCGLRRSPFREIYARGGVDLESFSTVASRFFLFRILLRVLVLGEELCESCVEVVRSH